MRYLETSRTFRKQLKLMLRRGKPENGIQFALTTR
jgi:hypothetical protein